MKKIFTKILCAFAALFLLVGISAPAFAQYTATTVASNVGLSAIAKDSHGNTYVIENPNQGNTNRTTSGEIVEYTNGTGSGTVIYNGPYIADNDFGETQDYAYGIVVDSNNNIYFSTSNGQQYTYGAIIKLTYNGSSPFNPIASNYSAAPYITSVFNGTIGYPTGMAIDASNNLYVLQYDANDGTNNYGAYTVAKYAAGNTTTYTEIYKGLELYNTATSGTAICALAVDPVSGNVYVADWYDYLNGETYAGFIEKLTYSGGSYTPSTLYNNYAYCQALACDASGNVYANIGSGNDQETTVKTVEFVGGSGSPVPLYSGLRGDLDYWCYGMAVIGTTIFTGEGNQNVTNQEGYYMELTAPSINSITANNAYTNAGSETFTVTFSAAITGVTASNFSLTTSGVSGASVGTPTTGNNITWSVPVNTGSGNGTIGLNLANTTGLEYGLSNPLPYTGGTTTVDKTAPTINIGSPSVSSIITGTGSVTYTVTYFDANFNSSTLATGNITLNSTGGASGTIGVSGSGTTRTVTISGITGTGTLGISIAAGTASDLAGNTAPASGASATFNVVQPTITVPGGTTTLTSTTSGTPGSSTSFNISASNLNPASGSLTITAPTNVQVSPDNSTWNSSYTQSYSGSTLGSTTVYARLAGTGTVGTISGNISVSGGGATTVTQAVSGTLNTPSTTISSLTAVSSTTTNAASVQYTATFAASVSGLSTADFTLNTTGVTGASVAAVGGSGTSWTVTVNTGGGSGTIQLAMNSSSGVTPSVSNASSGSPFAGSTYTIDKTAPTVSSINAASPSNINPTNATSVTYTVTFSEAVTGVDASDFTLTTSGVSGSVSGVSGSGNTYAVTVSSISGNGTLRLDLNSSGTGITDAAGNAIGGGFTSGSVYTIDQTAPTVSSINAASPSNINPTNATSVTYTVTFSEAVTGVDASDFTLTTSGVSGSVSGVSGGGTTYAVTVSSITGNGTLRLDLNSSGTGITDLAGNAISGGFTSGSVYTIDQTPPTVSSINAASPSNINPTNATSVTYTVTFSEAVTGVDASDFTLTTSGVSGAVSGVSGNGTTYAVTVSSISGNGTLRLDLNSSGTGITDLAGNAISGGFTSGSVYNIDNTAPTFTGLLYTSSNANSAYAKVGDVVTLNFGTSETVQTPSVTIAGHAVTVTNTGGNNYTASYTMTSGDTEGRIPYALTATDLAGNSSNETDVAAGDLITFDMTAPTVMISAPSVASIATGGSGTVTYTVTYADANFNTSNLGNSAIMLNTTGTANGTVNVSGGGTSYTVTISNITGEGSLGISVAAGNASDLAGNTDAGAGPSGTFNVLSTDALLSNLTLNAGPLTPGFSSGVHNYTRTLVNGVNAVTIVPTADDAGATIQIVGIGTIASGSTSNPIPVSVGSNTITINVTAADGVTTQTYTLTLIKNGAKNDLLSSLKLSKGVLSPVFAGTTGSYTSTVAETVSSITITPTTADPNATVTVNGTTVSSGTASAPITLALGPNVITTTVTAQNDTATRTYTVTVTRAVSSNSLLSLLRFNPGLKIPIFQSSVTSYIATVVNGVAATMVTPVTSDPNATVTINGQAATSGTPFGPVALSVGSNVITTVVTAQDGVTQTTYTVTVTRAESTNDRLLSLKVSRGTLSPTFAPATTSYTDDVVDGVQSLTVTPTLVDPNATMLLNGTTPIASGATSDPITLAVGSNTITIQVTAADGSTNQTYTLTVTRAPAPLDGYGPGISVTKPTGDITFAEDGIVVHQGVSPNGDGINDFLQIDNISQYPDNKLSIMNRNGQLVYETNGYDNSSKAFDGHSNKNGQMQLPGTYFYQLDYTVSGITKHKTGFIILKY